MRYMMLIYSREDDAATPAELKAVGAHGMRHTGQILEVKSLPTFPQRGE